MISGGSDASTAVMRSARGTSWMVRDWERQPLKQYGPFDSKEEADIHSDLNERPTSAGSRQAAFGKGPQLAAVLQPTAVVSD